MRDLDPDITAAQLELELKRLGVGRVSWSLPMSTTSTPRQHRVLLVHNHLIGVSVGRGDSFIAAVNAAIADAERQLVAYLEHKDKERT